MSVSNVSTGSALTGVNGIDANQTQTSSVNQQSQAQAPATETVRREDTSGIGASLLKAQLLSASAQPAASPINPSLDPQGAFGTQASGFLQNTLNLPTNKVRQGQTVLTVNSANALQTEEITLKGGGRATLFYTGGFPPTSTATLPRIAFEPQGALSFYDNAGALSDFQLQSVQNLYAGDLASRKNYSTNLANLAKNLTSISNSGELDKKTQKQVDSAINSLMGAYNTLSNATAPAPSPRDIYAMVADAYKSLQSDKKLSDNVNSQINTGLNILVIGAANYDANRVPVAGTAGTPAPLTPTPDQIAAAGFPLPAFNTVRNAPLSAAQATPAAVFGNGVTSYLQSIGLNNIDPNNINYQVNSADKLQNIMVPLGGNKTVTVFFNGGFPVPTGTAPQVAFSGRNGARKYLDLAMPSPAVQPRLQTYYANPANAARRSNYVVNLNNFTSAFQTLLNGNNLKQPQIDAIQNSLSVIDNARQQVLNGGLPDILAVYQQIGDNLDLLSKNQSSLNSTQRDTLRTLNGSLLPVGIQNYYLVPAAQSLM